MARRRDSNRSLTLSRRDSDQPFLPCIIATVAPGENSVSQTSYRCNFCHFATNDKEYISRHVNDHFFRCTLCSFYTDRQHELLKHNAEKHSKPYPLPYSLISLDEHKMSSCRRMKSLPLLVLGSEPAVQLRRTKGSVPNDHFISSEVACEQREEATSLAPVTVCTPEVSQVYNPVGTCRASIQPSLLTHSVDLQDSSTLLSGPTIIVPAVKPVAPLNYLNINEYQTLTNNDSQEIYVAEVNTEPLEFVAPKLRTPSLKLLSAYSDSDEPEIAVGKSVVVVGEKMFTGRNRHLPFYANIMYTATELFCADGLKPLATSLAVQSDTPTLDIATSSHKAVTLQFPLGQTVSTPMESSDVLSPSCLVKPDTLLQSFKYVKLLDLVNLQTAKIIEVNESAHEVVKFAAPLEASIHLKGSHLSTTSMKYAQIKHPGQCHVQSFERKWCFQSVTHQTETVPRFAFVSSINSERQQPCTKMEGLESLRMSFNLSEVAESVESSEVEHLFLALHGDALPDKTALNNQQCLLPVAHKKELVESEAEDMDGNVVIGKRTLRNLPSRQAANVISSRGKAAVVKPTLVAAPSQANVAPEEQENQIGPNGVEAGTASVENSENIRRSRRTSGKRQVTNVAQPQVASVSRSSPDVTALALLPVVDHYAFEEADEELNKGHWNGSSKSLESRPDSRCSNTNRDDQPVSSTESSKPLPVSPGIPLIASTERKVKSANSKFNKKLSVAIAKQPRATFSADIFSDDSEPPVIDTKIVIEPECHILSKIEQETCGQPCEGEQHNSGDKSPGRSCKRPWKGKTLPPSPKQPLRRGPLIFPQTVMKADPNPLTAKSPTADNNVALTPSEDSLFQAYSVVDRLGPSVDKSPHVPNTDIDITLTPLSRRIRLTRQSSTSQSPDHVVRPAATRSLSLNTSQTSQSSTSNSTVSITSAHSQAVQTPEKATLRRRQSEGTKRKTSEPELVRRALNRLMKSTSTSKRSHHFTPLPNDKSISFGELSESETLPALLSNIRHLTPSPVKQHLQQHQTVEAKSQLEESTINRVTATCNACDIGESQGSFNSNPADLHIKMLASRRRASSTDGTPHAHTCRLSATTQNDKRDRQYETQLKVNNKALPTKHMAQPHQVLVLDKFHSCYQSTEICPVPMVNPEQAEHTSDPLFSAIITEAISLYGSPQSVQCELSRASYTMITSYISSSVVKYHEPLLSVDQVSPNERARCTVLTELFPFDESSACSPLPTLECERVSPVESDVYKAERFVIKDDTVTDAESPLPGFSASPDSSACKLTFGSRSYDSDISTEHQVVDEVLNSESAPEEGLHWESDFELSEDGVSSYQLVVKDNNPWKEKKGASYLPMFTGESADVSSQSSPECFPQVVQAKVAPVMVFEQCATTLLASLSPTKLHQERDKKCSDVIKVDSDISVVAEITKPMTTSFQCLKSRLQLAVQKGALTKRPTPVIKSSNATKSKPRKSSSSRSCGDHTKSDDSSSKSRHDKKPKKKHKRKHKDSKSCPSVPKISIDLTSPTKDFPSSKKKRHKRESVSLEDSLIFYPVPSDTNDQANKQGHAFVEQNRPPPAIESNTAQSNVTSVMQEKKRKSRESNKQPKHKKSKLSKMKRAKPNELENVDESVSQTGHSSKLPWCNTTITDVLRCHLCDFICLENDDLLEHKQEVHAARNRAVTLAPCEYDPVIDQNVQYKCTLCGLADDRLKRIRTHITSHHAGKLNSCERVTHLRAETGFTLLVESVGVYKQH